MFEDRKMQLELVVEGKVAIAEVNEVVSAEVIFAGWKEGDAAATG